MNLFISTVTTQLTLDMSESSKGYQTATGVDRDGGVHTSMKVYKVVTTLFFSCLFQPPLHPLSSTISPSPSSLSYFSRSATSLLLLLALDGMCSVDASMLETIAKEKSHVSSITSPNAVILPCSLLVLPILEASQH